MRYLLLAGSGLLAVMLAGPAFAADPAIEIPMDAPGFTWSGAYVGVAAGYAWGDHTETEFVDGGGATGFEEDYDSEGFVGGVFAGYNWQSSSFVYGVEADLEYSDVDGGYSNGGTGTEIDVEWQGSVRGRLGIAFDRILVYGTAGVAFADTQYEFTSGGAFDEDFDETLVGWTVGGGVDAAVTDRIFVRGEYRYTDLGDVNLDAQNSFAGFNYDDDATFHTVRLGVGYKF